MRAISELPSDETKLAKRVIFFYPGNRLALLSISNGCHLDIFSTITIVTQNALRTHEGKQLLSYVRAISELPSDISSKLKRVFYPGNRLALLSMANGCHLGIFSTITMLFILGGNSERVAHA